MTLYQLPNYLLDKKNATSGCLITTQTEVQIFCPVHFHTQRLEWDYRAGPVDANESRNSVAL